jgi:hypothetical protein
LAGPYGVWIFFHPWYGLRGLVHGLRGLVHGLRVRVWIFFQPSFVIYEIIIIIIISRNNAKTDDHTENNYDTTNIENINQIKDSREEPPPGTAYVSTSEDCSKNKNYDQNQDNYNDKKNNTDKNKDEFNDMSKSKYGSNGCLMTCRYPS